MLKATPCECVQQSGFSGVAEANRLLEQELHLSMEHLQLSMARTFVRVLVVLCFLALGINPSPFCHWCNSPPDF